MLSMHESPVPWLVLHARALLMRWSHSSWLRKPLSRKALGDHDRCTTSPRHSSCARSNPDGDLNMRHVQHKPMQVRWAAGRTSTSPKPTSSAEPRVLTSTPRAPAASSSTSSSVCRSIAFSRDRLAGAPRRCPNRMCGNFHGDFVQRSLLDLFEAASTAGRSTQLYKKWTFQLFTSQHSTTVVHD